MIEKLSVATGMLEMSGISKSFGGSRALDGVSIRVEPGKVHALCGANGAGKSTLIKILAGLESADAGTICLGGQMVEIASPKNAARLGFSFIHQELNLVPKFTVLQNMAMGSDDRGRWGTFDKRRIRRQARAVQERLGSEIPLDERAESLTVADRWMVSLGRALMRDARLVAMDEPTASFSDSEAERLFRVVDELKSQGVAILYVSHRLDEVLDVADTITVFRNGKNVITVDAALISKRELTQHIVGRDVDLRPSPRHVDEVAQAPVTLSVRNLRRRPRVEDVSLEIRVGEIVGLAGLVGAGRTELARLLVGADRPEAGSVVLKGHSFTPRSPHEAIRAGVAMVPEERRSEGLILTASIEANLAMAAIGSARSMWAIHNPKESRRRAEGLMASLGVKAESSRSVVHSLSGGNQQKVVVGKYLRTLPAVLILDEPSVGVDVGAREEIYRLIGDLAARGLSVLLISSDFDEFEICERVLIMRNGEITSEVRSGQIDKDYLTSLCFGDHPTEK